MASSSLFTSRALASVLLLLLAAGMWFYMARIAPRERAAQLGEAQFQSTLGDLYSPWRGTRELLLHHRDPYSAEVTRDIQTEYYGKALDNSPEGPHDQQRFAYPVYVALLLAPAAHLPFNYARSILRWMLAAITLASIPLWQRLAPARSGTASLIVTGALTLASVPVIQALNLQQLALLVAGLLAGCAALLTKQCYRSAGILLALASIKPQMAALITAWLMLWALSDWKKRKAFAASYALSMTALVLAGEWLLPGWIPEFVRGIVAYARYTDSSSWLALWLPRALALIGAAALVVGLVAVGWRSRLAAGDSPAFAFTFALVLVVTIMIVPATKPVFNQILLLPALLLAAQDAPATWARNLLSRALLVLWWGIAGAPWVLAAGVILVWLFLPAALQHVWSLPLYLSLLLPLAAFGLLTLRGKTTVQGRGLLPGLPRPASEASERPSGYRQEEHRNARRRPGT